MFFICSCSNDSTEEPKPEVNSQSLNLSVSYDETFDNIFYPSILLSFVGNVNFFDVSLNNPLESSTELKLIISETEISEETTIIQTLENGSHNVPLSINWKERVLSLYDQPSDINLVFKAYINDTLIDTKTVNLNVRAVNECVYTFTSGDMIITFPYAFAGYVNEDHPEIDLVLQEALSEQIVDSFTGYQTGNEDNVINQVFAIWLSLQRKGIKYSSITDTSNSTDKVFSQYVRFFDQTLKYNQANCVDGSVFLASILKKIDIKPFLVLSPGHMYLGFYTNENKTHFRLLETTWIGWIDYESSSLEELENHFINSMDNQVEDYNKNRNSYHVIDIEEARKMIKPISR